MHKIKDIFKDNFTTMGANTASHEEQHYLWASVSEGKLWWFSSMISLPKEFLCTCYPEQTSKHALSHYQLPFFHFPTSYMTVHCQLHSSCVLNVTFLKEFKGKILLLRTFQDRVNFLRYFRNFRMSGRPADDRTSSHISVY